MVNSVVSYSSWTAVVVGCCLKEVDCEPTDTGDFHCLSPGCASRVALETEDWGVVGIMMLLIVIGSLTYFSVVLSVSRKGRVRVSVRPPASSHRKGALKAS